jgi:hypothetical protein
MKTAVITIYLLINVNDPTDVIVLKEKPDIKEDKKECVEPIPGLPAICDGVGNARTSKYRKD